MVLALISALGVLNGGTGLVQMFLYVNGDNRPKLPLISVNIVVFLVSLVYVPIRRQRFKAIRQLKEPRG
jgi:hypothetical protein